jgi:hypothetical protein
MEMCISRFILFTSLLVQISWHRGLQLLLSFVPFLLGSCLLCWDVVDRLDTTQCNQPVRSAYQPLANSTFLSEQTSHQQSASSTFLSEQISTSHQPPAKVA